MDMIRFGQKNRRFCSTEKQITKILHADIFLYEIIATVFGCADDIFHDEMFEGLGMVLTQAHL